MIEKSIGINGSRACLISVILFLLSCNGKQTKIPSDITRQMTDSVAFKSGYSNVNDLSMYYEVYRPTDQAGGEDRPLVLIHGGGSTIQTSFGRVIPRLAKHRRVIGVEMQAHGRTSDRDADLTFEQDADDIDALLHDLDIERADLFGFSNGGTTALQVAIRHPDKVGKIIAASALCKRSGVPSGFWDFMKQARLENMPEALKEAYREVAPDPGGLQIMHDRDVKRMVHFTDIPDGLIKSIQAPTLFIIGDRDVITPDHALEMHRLVAGSRLSIIPGGHGEYMGEIMALKPGNEESYFVVQIIEDFLDQH